MADSTCFRWCTGRGTGRSLFFFRQLEISAPPRCFLFISVTDPRHVTTCECSFWALWDVADGRRQGDAQESFRPWDSSDWDTRTENLENNSDITRLVR